MTNTHALAASTDCEKLFLAVSKTTALSAVLSSEDVIDTLILGHNEHESWNDRNSNVSFMHCIFFRESVNG